MTKPAKLISTLLRLLLSLMLFTTTSCTPDEEFIFELDDLLNTQWGIPMVVEPGTEPIDFDAPTVFTADGVVAVGLSRFDFWNIRPPRTIVIEEADELWFIIELSPDTLYVEKTRRSGGAFIGKVIYEPLE